MVGPMGSSFVHLHVHSEYSMLEGALRVAELVERAEALDMPAVAITDRGNMHAAVQLVKACKGKNVKPILGVEIQVVPGDRREDALKPAPHLVLLAASQEGYQNIVRIVSRAWAEGLYRGVPRADFELLRAHSEGVVCLTACMAGIVPQAILEQGPDAGRIELERLKGIYGSERLFVELEDHGFPENEPLNEILVELAEELGLRVVATNCAHFLDREKAKSQVALRCIGTGHSLREMEQIHHKSAEMYFKDEAEMRELFARWPEAVTNSLVVAELCAGKCTPLHDPKLPRFPVPEGETEESFLYDLVKRGLEARFAELQKIGAPVDEALYRARAEEELGIICRMGFAGYFLIVQDFINWAKGQRIPVGPGRGSGAGSLVAYALRITNLDPIPYGLLFERFLNPERVSMPDFDIDFCTDRREEVIDYVREKYGRLSVGQIATFHQLKSRSVVRDVGRVMGMAPQDAGRIATLIPEPVGGKVVPIKTALAEVPQLAALVETDPEARAVISTAQDLENLTRHAGMHAAGVVMSEGPIWDHVPVFCPEQGVLVTQYHKDDVEAAGLVKFDFLGLKTLTVLDVAIALVNRRPDRKGDPLDIDTLPLDDAATYALLQSGETSNVFQLESSGMQQFFKHMKPDCFEDIVAAVALYRPGPMGADMHVEFADRKRGRQPVRYPHPATEEILRPTLGAIVYQEQVMQIAQQMGGYTLGGADLLRRAMGKKKEEEMAKQKASFVDGAVTLGTPADEAGRVFDLMAHFAGYGFNKSHSAAYALLTYQTAYLKAHYPAEFMCAALSVDKERSESVVATVQETRSMGIHVLPPDVNQSAVDFTVVYTRPLGDSEGRPKGRPACEGGRMRDPYEPRIRFGLGALKGVGNAALEAVFEARDVAEGGATRHEPFVDLFDFAERVDLRRVNKNVCEALVQSGAFDEVHAERGVHRARAFEAIPIAIDSGKKRAAEKASGQTSLFGLLNDVAAADSLTRSVATFPEVDAWDSKELLAREKSSLGFYVSGHPLDRYEKELARFCTCNSQTVQGMDGGQEVVLGGMVEGYRERRTKSGDTMAFFHLEDAYGRIEIIVRPAALETDGIRQALVSGEPIVVTGRVRFEVRNEGEDEKPETKLQLKSAELLSEALSRKAAFLRIRVSVDDVDRSSLARLRSTLERFPGGCPVRLELANSGAFAVELKQTGLFVEPNDDLLSSLERLFGRRVSELR
jgi:DNA polymerase III subunit alpha